MKQERARRAPVVVVTGASAGIGRAIAREFAAHGWRVALAARGHDGLEGGRAEIEALGAQAMVLPTDVADEAQVEAAAAQVEAAWGPIDVWVNDAMATIFAPVLEIAPADLRRATEVTYLGSVWGTRAALRCELAHAHARSKVHITMVQLSAFNTPQFAGRTPRQAVGAGARRPRRARPLRCARARRQHAGVADHASRSGARIRGGRRPARGGPLEATSSNRVGRQRHRSSDKVEPATQTATLLCTMEPVLCRIATVRRHHTHTYKEIQ